MAISILECFTHAELSLLHQSYTLRQGIDERWGCPRDVGKSCRSGRVYRLPFIVSLHKTLTLKRGKIFKVKNPKSHRMNRKARKNTQEKKDIFNKKGQ